MSVRDETIPEDNSVYKTREYWEERYAKDKGIYEWFKGYEHVRNIVNNHTKEADLILNVGCGNSEFSVRMYEDGYQSITNIDFSDTVINDMTHKFSSSHPNMSWKCMDALCMDFANQSFDVVIEKGTIDALLCAQSSAWTVPDDIAKDVHRMCSEISRVLKPNGVFISITFAQPHFRKLLIDNDEFNWDLQVLTIGDFFHYFVYVMTKTS